MPSSVARTPNCAASRARVGDLGGVQQRLGRDAAAVQAGAPEQVLLDEGDAHAELGGAQRAGVAAAPSPEDDDVMGGLGGGRHPVLLPCCGVSVAPAAGVCRPDAAQHPVTPGAWSHTSRTRRSRGWSRGRPRSTPYRVRMAWWRRGRGRAGTARRGRPRRRAGAPRGLRPDPARGRGVRRAGDQRHRDDGRAHRARRRVDPAGTALTPGGLRRGPRSLDIPVYDVNLTGYPARMRRVDLAPAHVRSSAEPRTRPARPTSGRMPPRALRGGATPRRVCEGWGDPPVDGRTPCQPRRSRAPRSTTR